MAGWNLALRFGLELAALAGLAAFGWRSTSGPAQWVLVIGVPVAAVVAWALFNVPGDPSRSGRAPIVVPGWLRLALELVILGAGAASFLIHGPQWIGVGLVALIVIHYAASPARIGWLLRQ